MNRLLCRLLGCIEAPEAPCCVRCGADSREDGFRWGWWPRLKWELRHVFPPQARCQQCRRRLWLRRVDGSFCSQKCHDNWIPF